MIDWTAAMHAYEPRPDGRCASGWVNDHGKFVPCTSSQASSVLHYDESADERERHWHDGGDCLCFDNESTYWEDRQTMSNESHIEQSYKSLPGDVNICTGKNTSDHNNCERVYGFGYVDSGDESKPAEVRYSLMVSMLVNNNEGIKNSWTDLSVEQVRALSDALNAFLNDYKDFFIISDARERLTR